MKLAKFNPFGRKGKEKITLIIPAFNEARNIRRVLEAALRARKKGVIQEIVVVNDGSTDKTGEVAESIGKGEIKVINFPRNMGKANAFIAGAIHCLKNGSTIMVALDADLVNVSPGKIKQLVKPLIKDKRIKMAVGTFCIVPYKRTDHGHLSLSGQRALRVGELHPLIAKGNNRQKELLLGGEFGLEKGLNILFAGSADLFRVQPYPKNSSSNVCRVETAFEAIASPPGKKNEEWVDNLNRPRERQKERDRKAKELWATWIRRKQASKRI